MLQDARFNPEVDQRTGYKTRRVLCMPVKNSSGEVIGVAQAINKITVQPFNEHDEKVSLARNVFSDKTKSVPDFGHQIIRLFSVNSDKMQIR